MIASLFMIQIPPSEWICLPVQALFFLYPQIRERPGKCATMP